MGRRLDAAVALVLRGVASTLWGWRGSAAGQIIEIGGDVYLWRTYLTPRSSPVGVFLHFFRRGDADRELHNHPWDLSAGLILTGGYVEERRVGNEVVRRAFRPGQINIIRANDFHRVDLLNPAGCWTLFVRRKRVQDWGFWNRVTGSYTPWRNFTLERI